MKVCKALSFPYIIVILINFLPGTLRFLELQVTWMVIAQNTSYSVERPRPTDHQYHDTFSRTQLSNNVCHEPVPTDWSQGTVNKAGA
jgi:hypothetical protein